MKRNGSGPSLRSLRKSLTDSIEELDQFFKLPCWDVEVGGREAITTEFWAMGAMMKPIILHLQAYKKLARERKEAIIAKGKIYMCFKFPARFRLWWIEGDVKSLEREVAKIVDVYLKVARNLYPELFPYTNNIWFDAKNITGPEMAMVLFPRLTEEDNKEPGEPLRLEWNQGNKFREDGDGDGGDLA